MPKVWATSLIAYNMKENRRVGLSILLWVCILLGFTAAGIYGIQRVTLSKTTTTPPEVATEVATEIITEEVATIPTSTITITEPKSVGLDSERLQLIDTVVSDYISRGTIPGAVVAIVRGDRLAYIEAFGSKAVEDATPMSIETPFDIASLTKPIVTATAILQLMERGELRLGERVKDFIPGFEDWHDKRSGKRHDIRIIELLTHTSALPVYISLKHLAKEYPDAKDLGIEHLMDYITHCDRELPDNEGESRYSCLNYITLGRIVEHITGIALNEYAEQYILTPLGMENSCFNPTAEYAMLCAPTSLDEEGRALCGVVEDPLAREIMGGVSGNAGLFSTAEDIAKFAAMMLNNGSWGGTQILSPLSIDALFNTPEGYEASRRTLGWRAATQHNDAAGDLLIGDESIVHTGATGTSIVINRGLNIAVIILTNRANSGGTKSDMLDLRSKVCNVVAGAIRE